MPHYTQKIFHLFQQRPYRTSDDYSQRPDSTALISDLLDKFMQENKPFLHFGYGVVDLAEELHIPAWRLSKFISLELGLSFNEYLNHYRVRHCEELIHKGLVSRSKLKSLAHQCGFISQNTLTSSFKKCTGFSLSRYHRGWEKLLSSEVYD